jgi:DNA-binding transcriptional MerR regulator
MADRSHLSIGEVLSLLQDDFPDVTISKIRFLESQGLLDPERTPSGYRKFYEDDIERLRWILRHQRDHFLPLKVMKDRLEESAAAGVAVPPDEPPASAPAAPPSLFEEPAARAEGDGHDLDPAGPVAVASATSEPRAAALAPAPVAEAEPAPAAGGADAAPATVEAPPPAAAPPPVPSARPSRPEPVSTRSARPAPTMPPLPARPNVNPLDAGPTGISFTLAELSEASGLSARELGELERYGLLAGHLVAGDTFYDGEALIVARTAAGFVRFGIEARHLRMYKVAAEREAGFMEQVIMPLLKQRNPTARQQAADNLGELAGLGEQLRSALLRVALREHTDPR